MASAPRGRAMRAFSHEARRAFVAAAGAIHWRWACVVRVGPATAPALGDAPGAARARTGTRARVPATRRARVASGAGAGAAVADRRGGGGAGRREDGACVESGEEIFRRDRAGK